MNAKVLDGLDRVGWTFVQALAGSFFAGGVAISQHEWDWRAALTGACAAALICLLKVLGVNVSLAAKRDPIPIPEPAPGPEPVPVPVPEPASGPVRDPIVPVPEPAPSPAPSPVPRPAPVRPSPGEVSAAGAAEGF